MRVFNQNLTGIDLSDDVRESSRLLRIAPFLVAKQQYTPTEIRRISEMPTTVGTTISTVIETPSEKKTDIKIDTVNVYGFTATFFRNLCDFLFALLGDRKLPQKGANIAHYVLVPNKYIR